MKKKFPLAFCSRSFTLSSLLMRGRKLVGSLRNVIRRRSRNVFIPDKRLWGDLAVVCKRKKENEKQCTTKKRKVREIPKTATSSSKYVKTKNGAQKRQRRKTIIEASRNIDPNLYTVRCIVNFPRENVPLRTISARFAHFFLHCSKLNFVSPFSITPPLPK